MVGQSGAHLRLRTESWTLHLWKSHKIRFHQSLELLQSLLPVWTLVIKAMMQSLELLQSPQLLGLHPPES